MDHSIVFFSKKKCSRSTRGSLLVFIIRYVNGVIDLSRDVMRGASTASFIYNRLYMSIIYVDYVSFVINPVKIIVSPLRAMLML